MQYCKTSSLAFLFWLHFPVGKGKKGCGDEGGGYSRAVSITQDTYCKEATIRGLQLFEVVFECGCAS